MRGTLPPGSPGFVYVPVEVPRGVRGIHVAHTYDRSAGTPASASGCA
ncbi:hypothetical protein [Streptomyces sp. NPDC048392]